MIPIKSDPRREDDKPRKLIFPEIPFSPVFPVKILIGLFLERVPISEAKVSARDSAITDAYINKYVGFDVILYNRIAKVDVPTFAIIWIITLFSCFFFFVNSFVMILPKKTETKIIKAVIPPK